MVVEIAVPVEVIAACVAVVGRPPPIVLGAEESDRHRDGGRDGDGAHDGQRPGEGGGYSG